MFGWPWSKKESKPMVPPPPPVASPSIPPAGFEPLPPMPRSVVAERIERLPPLPFSEEMPSAPSPRIHAMPVQPPIPKPVTELDSLRASIEASIAQRGDQKVFDTISLDSKATSPFNSADGQHFSTLRDFGNALLVMDEQTFNHHVNPHKNDFANWIEHCFSPDVKKIGTMLRGKSRQDMARLFNYALQPPLQRTEPLAASLDLTPLPPSPLQETSEHRVQSIQAAINDVSSQVQSNPLGAKDSFITLRTRIWQELSDDERRQVLPQLRALYERIRYTK